MTASAWGNPVVGGRVLQQHRLRRLDACTPAMLGIESAPAGHNPSSGDTDYVVRTHDSALRARLASAKNGVSTVVTMTGSMMAGKKRSAWEAIKDGAFMSQGWVLWPLFHPATPEELSAVLPCLPPRSILWLPQLERYFPGRSPAEDDRLALALRTLLHDERRAPIVVLLTTSTRHWRALSIPDNSGVRAPAEHLRRLLYGSDIAVPSSFTSDEMARARQSPHPGVAEAAQRCHDGEVVQYLAVVPYLRARFDNLLKPERAVLDTALDLRRLGHSPWMSKQLLEQACGLDASLGDSAFVDAIGSLLEPNAAGESILVERTTASARGRSVEYRVHEWVERHGIRQRATLVFRSGLLDALSEHADPACRVDLSAQCEARGMLREAVGFALQYTDERAGWRRAGTLLQSPGWIDDAIACLRQAVLMGDAEALRSLYRLCVEQGRLGDLADWWPRLTPEETAQTWLILGHVHTSLGRSPRKSYQRAALAGDDSAMAIAAAIMAEEGKLTEAVQWLVSLATEGRFRALRACLMSCVCGVSCGR